ncbi:MAG TPA: peptidoglycan DD-metalloendopeptidase family protein [bacterium]|nr:peptidoglycan DD-metalloendopeptidase family protein [bacterium]
MTQTLRRLTAPLAAILIAATAASGYELLSFEGSDGRTSLASGMPAPTGFGWGYVDTDRSTPCLTAAERADIWKELEKSRTALRAAGRLSAPDPKATVLFEWPLKPFPNRGFKDEGYHGISNYVDQDTTAGIQDYNCGTRSYDGHRGTDYFLWPFTWLKKSSQHVQVVAPADGVIILKTGFNPDTSCVWAGQPWNAVYLEHFDGSITWSGHLRKGGLTPRAVGDTVYTGEKLGWVGSSGNSDGPHLHLEVYDPGGNLIDPYTGACNSLNGSSWWASERPYYDSGINAVMTHSAPPVFPPCPQDEITNEAFEFPATNPSVRMAVYYRDQLDTQTSDYRVLQPDGTVWTSWSHSSSQPHYSASFFNWVWNLGSSPQQGVWTFEVTYLGETYTQLFGVGTNAVDAPLVAAGESFELLNRPNPLTRDTEILFRLPDPGNVRVSIHDVSGRLVRRVLDERRPAGAGSVRWNGLGAAGSPVAAGVYFYRLETDGISRTRKMAVVR